jgi:NO-binding membrane sensor protein with MHYT domain
MFKVLACLRDQHDYRLVLLAVLICAVASFTAFHIYANARDSQGAKRLGWVFLTGVATGAGIWATHFVAMLAFKTGLPAAYDPALTLASLLIAISVTGRSNSRRSDLEAISIWVARKRSLCRS